MFQDIITYMLNSREERRKHLKLEEPCIEIGGSSVPFKGLLAHHLKTTIPLRNKILLCHACHNGACSNVNHLYWGTYKDNNIDHLANGEVSFHEKTLRKYGIDKLRDMARVARISALEANKKPIEYWESFRPYFELADKTKRGWKTKLEKELGVSHSQFGRIEKKLFK